MANSIKVKRSATPSAAPTTANLELGELAINTYDGRLYIKKDNGTASIVEVGTGSTAYTEYNFTATASQTTFAVGVSMILVNVFLNGIRLLPTTDYAISGTNIILTTGAGASDIIVVLVYSNSAVGGTVTSVSVTTANGVSGTVATATTTPAITLSLTKTGTSTTYVTDTSPTLTTPVINGFTGDTSVINIGSGQVYKDASGNVGIGTASPVAPLSVVGDILAPTFNTNTTYTIGIQDAQVNSFIGSRRGNLKIQASSAISGGEGMGGGDLTLQAGNSYIGNNTADGNILLKSGFNTVTSGAAYQGGYIGLYTGYNSPEVMRVHASGGVSIGNTTDPGATNLSVTGSIAGASLSLTNALPVTSGGTGLATLTANNVILGAGTSSPTFVAPSTSGNLLTSNGTTWVSSTPAASGITTGKAIAMSLIFGL